MFDDYLSEWALSPDGPPIVTPYAQLLPVRWRGIKAMLKVATAPEEAAGIPLLAWWDGEGAARVLAHAGHAILLERAEGKGNLATLARNSHDDEATRILCAVIARLHAPRPKPLPSLISLDGWFRELAPAAAAHGGILHASAAAARDLLAAAPKQPVPLHGDVHHYNVLDFGERGWLAIDPKGILGERAFDYCTLFFNPDHATATAQGRLARQLDVVATAAQLDAQTLLRWILAFGGLSAAWHFSEGTSPDIAIEVATIAYAELHK